ncbi:hypothetical protein LCGC14_0791170 [marine sediment metagenome]|uniref:Uncharacterized protein n=1 Tax=marine sediment metagenome TaxID=412755 RepID=A0A0F9PSL2_9ZZZZ
MNTRTYAVEKKHQATEIKEHWFKDHKAVFTNLDKITTLEWRKPDTIIFYTRYVFDGYYMYVSGDLGEAVFRFTEEAIPERIARYNLSYFREKLRAFCDPTEDFSRAKAIQYLDERIQEYEDEKIEHDRATFEELRAIINDSDTYGVFHIHLASLDIYRLGSDAWEWIDSIGSTTPMRIMAYLIGIQMAVA